VTFEDPNLNETYVWLIPNDDPFEKGKIYTYELKIEGQAVVVIKSSITPWDEISDAVTVFEDTSAAHQSTSSTNQKQQRP
jgi:hypothetical protein